MSPSSTVDVLVVCFCAVEGENEELLGTDETDISEIYWVAIDVYKKKIINAGDYVIETDNARKDKPELCEEAKINESENPKGKRTEGNDMNRKKPPKIHSNDGKTSTSEKKLGLCDALTHFQDTLKHLSKDSRVVRLLCENSLHLRQCLHPRAFRHDIALSETFYKYFDLAHQYKLYKATSSRTLRSIAKDIYQEDTSEDSFTSAKKKCDLCARIVIYLLKKGHSFIKAQEINMSLESGMTEGDVDEETVARVRGLPWQVSDADVASFFRGLNIERGGVALCLNEKGRRNGEALVRFSDPEHRELALRRHKHHLFGRYIEVYKAMAQEFTKSAQAPVSAMQCVERYLMHGGNVLIRMRGLPFDACVDDIVEFFGENPEVFRGNEGVMLVTDGDGNPTGDAFVLFDTEGEGQLALGRHRENIGKRYVELFRSTRAEMQQVLTMYTNMPQMMTSSISPILGPDPHNIQQKQQQQVVLSQTNMSCLRMRGVPHSVGEKEILAFLSTHKSHVIGSIHLMWSKEGSGTRIGGSGGEVLLQMRGEDMAWRCAKDLHLQHLCGRFVEVFQCSVREMACSLATSVALHLINRHISNHVMNQLNNTSHFTHITYQPPPVLNTVELPATISNVEARSTTFTSPLPTAPPQTPGILATPHDMPLPGCRMLPPPPFPPPPPPPPPLTQLPQSQGVSANGLVFQNITLIPIYSNQSAPLMTPFPMGHIPPPPPPPYMTHPHPHPHPHPHSSPNIVPLCESVVLGSSDTLQVDVHQYKGQYGKSDLMTNGVSNVSLPNEELGG